MRAGLRIGRADIIGELGFGSLFFVGFLLFWRGFFDRRGAEGF